MSRKKGSGLSLVPNHSPSVTSRTPRGTVDSHTITREDSSYDHDEWIVPAEDAAKESVPITFKVPPSFARAAQIILQDPNIPYETVQELCRHAFARHLAWLDETRLDRGLAPHLLAGIKSATTILYDVVIEKKSNNLIADTVAKCQALQLSGDIFRARTLAQRVYQQIRSSADSPERTSLLQVFMRSLGPLLFDGDPISTNGQDSPSPSPSTFNSQALMQSPRLPDTMDHTGHILSFDEEDGDLTGDIIH